MIFARDTRLGKMSICPLTFVDCLLLICALIDHLDGFSVGLELADEKQWISFFGMLLIWHGSPPKSSPLCHFLNCHSVFLSLLKYITAFCNPSRLSPRLPIPMLQRWHNQPRISPVSWQWSMISLSFLSPQHSHTSTLICGFLSFHSWCNFFKSFSLSLRHFLHTFRRPLLSFWKSSRFKSLVHRRHLFVAVVIISLA